MKIVVTLASVSVDQTQFAIDKAFELYGEKLYIAYSSDFITILNSFECEKYEFGNAVLCASGYTTASRTNLQNVVTEALNTNDSVFTEQKSLGGIHTAHLSDGVKSICWPSIPACGGLFYAKWGKGVVVCNRPRLIAECLNSSLDFKYIDYLITTGYPLDDTTPFTEVKAIRGHELIKIDESGFSILPRMLSNMGRLSKDSVQAHDAELEFRVELANSLNTVTKKYNNILFNLSGGKDSRLLASVFFKLNKSIVTQTKGNTEQELASTIGELAGLKLVLPQVVDKLGSLENRTTKALELSDYLVETEAHTVLPSLSYKPIFGQDGVIFGHSHLQKGGAAKTGRDNKKDMALLNLSKSIIPEYVHSQVRIALQAELDTIKNWFSYDCNIDILYFPYAVLRAGRYLESQYAKIESNCTPIFPLNDEKMYIASSNLNRHRRRMELTVFDTIQDFCPSLNNVPLYNDKWRFQAPSDALPTPVSQSSPYRSIFKKVDQQRVNDLNYAQKILKTSNILERAKALIDNEILIKCGLIEGEHSNDHPGFNKRQQQKLMFRFWLAHMLHEKYG